MKPLWEVLMPGALGPKKKRGSGKPKGPDGVVLKPGRHVLAGSPASNGSGGSGHTGPCTAAKIRGRGLGNEGEPMMTDGQAAVFDALEEYTRPPTTRQLADNLERPTAFSRHWGYDRVNAILRRMRKKGWVATDERRPARWNVTSDGSLARLGD